jgi:DNA-binding protein HU-beta
MASRPATKAKVPAASGLTAAKKPGTPATAAAKPPILTGAPIAAAKKTAETVTLKGIFEQLAEGNELPKKVAHAMAAGLVEAVITHLKNGDRLRMSGLGILEVKDRPARMGRNPATGEAMQIAASRKVAFRVAKELKAAV